jgi:hypothetical protein
MERGTKETTVQPVNISRRSTAMTRMAIGTETPH